MMRMIKITPAAAVLPMIAEFLPGVCAFVVLLLIGGVVSVVIDNSATVIGPM